MFDLPTADGQITVTFSPGLDAVQFGIFQATIQGVRARAELIELLEQFATEQGVVASIQGCQAALQPQLRMPSRYAATKRMANGV